MIRVGCTGGAGVMAKILTLSSSSGSGLAEQLGLAFPHMLQCVSPSDLPPSAQITVHSRAARAAHAR